MAFNPWIVLFNTWPRPVEGLTFCWGFFGKVTSGGGSGGAGGGTTGILVVVESVPWGGVGEIDVAGIVIVFWLAVEVAAVVDGVTGIDPWVMPPVMDALVVEFDGVAVLVEVVAWVATEAVPVLFDVFPG